MRGSEDVVRKLRRSSLSGDAYTFVRDLFTNGTRYNPGEKISVEELSRELGVSRTPLWGAINRLEAEGIVEIVPRQGVYLINYDPDRALEIYEAREALEGMAARLAAEKISDRQAAALQANIDEQREQLTKGDIEGYHAKALEFHEQIAQIRPMRVQRNDMPMHLPQSCDDHEKLLKALRKGDPDRAEHEARTHMKDLTNEIRRTLQRQPAAFAVRKGAPASV
jgi:DNA-binding GntR family transcriptional regulator